MTQLTFTEAEYATKKRKTRREIFLEKIDALIPWKQLEKTLSEHYHKGISVDRPIHCRRCFAFTVCSCSTT